VIDGVGVLLGVGVGVGQTGCGYVLAQSIQPSALAQSKICLLGSHVKLAVLEVEVPII